MERREEERAPPRAAQELPHDWAERIRKLRWLGLDEEAKKLESAVAAQLPTERRRSVSGGPFNTD